MGVDAMSDAIDTTADEIGTELSTDVAPTHTQSLNLFHTDSPVEVVQRASEVADALKGVLVKQGLTKRISGREHVLVEGWTTLGSMLGVVPVCVWTRKLGNGWEARVEARTLDGRVIGAAEAECLTDESTWRSRDDYALRSMAQTRATSKALRGPLGFIVTLAGYVATPAEEMPADASSEPLGRASSTDPASEAQLKFLKSLIERHKPGPDVLRVMLRQVDADGVDPSVAGWSKALKKDQASRMIETLKSGTLPTGESDVPADAPEFEPASEGEGDDVPFS